MTFFMKSSGYCAQLILDDLRQYMGVPNLAKLAESEPTHAVVLPSIAVSPISISLSLDKFNLFIETRKLPMT